MNKQAEPTQAHALLIDARGSSVVDEREDGFYLIIPEGDDRFIAENEEKAVEVINNDENLAASIQTYIDEANGKTEETEKEQESGEKENAEAESQEEVQTKTLGQMNKDELKEEIDRLHEVFDQERQEMQEIIDDQEKKIESYKNALGTNASGRSRVVVEHEGNTYEVITPSFKFEGETHQAEELPENKELFVKLLNKGFGGIRKV